MGVYEGPKSGWSEMSGTYGWTFENVLVSSRDYDCSLDLVGDLWPYPGRCLAVR